MSASSWRRRKSRFGKAKTSGKGDAKAEAALREEIAQLKKALASAQTDKTSAEQEKTAAAAKLEDASKQITSVTQERDAAVAQLKGSKDAQERFQTLITENSDLKQKLADAEKTVREIGEDKPKKEQELADVKRQLEQLHQQLANSKKQNQDSEVTIADLRSQLDEVSGELEKVKLTGGNPEETARLTKENELLRGIVVRERQEEARREQAKKLMLAEFDKLKIKSDVLDQQIELLAQPVTKLTPEELSLLRQPVVGISDNNPATLKASFTVAKNTQAFQARARTPIRSANRRKTVPRRRGPTWKPLFARACRTISSPSPARRRRISTMENIARPKKDMSRFSPKARTTSTRSRISAWFFFAPEN